MLRGYFNFARTLLAISLGGFPDQFELVLLLVNLSQLSLLSIHFIFDVVKGRVLLSLVFRQSFVPLVIPLEVEFVLSLSFEVAAASSDDEEHMNHQVDADASNEGKA